VLSLITSIFTSRLVFPIPFIRALLHSMNFVNSLKNHKVAFDQITIDRFSLVLENARNHRKSTGFDTEEMDLKIVIVAAGKDFQMIRQVVANAIKYTPNYRIACIEIIAPDHLIKDELLLSLADWDKRISLVAEGEFLEVATLREIFSEIYLGRENWCLQQFLKYYSILNCENRFALVIDADTILLNSMSWLTKENKYLLIPTLEYTSEYYEVLIQLGAISELPDFSFVPHHMFYVVEEFKKMHLAIGNFSPTQFAQKIKEVSSPNTQSPFCIDYEMYGQYLYANYREKVALGRWANIQISRYWFSKFSKFRIWKLVKLILGLLFNSVSIHSWSKEVIPRSKEPTKS